MKTLKKIVLASAIGLASFGNLKNVSAQDNGYQIIRALDSFAEEKICWKQETSKGYFAGLTIIYYNDEDNDNFYENIKMFNCNKINNRMNNLIIEDFFINKETGQINWNWSICYINRDKWNKTYAKKTFFEVVKKDYPYKQNCKTGYNPYLTKDDLEKAGLANRIKRLIQVGASKNMEELKILAEEQRIYSKTTPLKY